MVVICKMLYLGYKKVVNLWKEKLCVDLEY